MEKKIEKIDYILIEGYDALKPERKGDVDYNYLAEKINEIIDHLNSQDQEEDILKDTKLVSSWVHNGKKWKEDTLEEWVCPKCGFDDCHPYRNSEDFGLMYCPECNELVKLLNNKVI